MNANQARIKAVHYCMCVRQLMIWPPQKGTESITTYQKAKGTCIYLSIIFDGISGPF